MVVRGVTRGGGKARGWREMLVCARIRRRRRRRRRLYAWAVRDDSRVLVLTLLVVSPVMA